MVKTKAVTPRFYTLAIFQSGIVAIALLLLLVLPQTTSALGSMGAAAWLWGCVAGLATYLALACLNRFSKTLQRNTLKTLGRMRHLFTSMTLWQLAAIAALAGIGEELLFRGFLQPFIASYSNAWVGLGLASLIFALLHFISWAYFVITLIIGLLLGVGYYLSQSLVLIILWHGVYDFIALWVLVHAPQVLGLPVASNNDSGIFPAASSK